MIGIELVRDRETKEPFARAERGDRAGRSPPPASAGLLLYSSTGHVDGRDGDLIVLGPPFTLTDEDARSLVERTAAAIASGRVSGTAALVGGPERGDLRPRPRPPAPAAARRCSRGT